MFRTVISKRTMRHAIASSENDRHISQLSYHKAFTISSDPCFFWSMPVSFSKGTRQLMNGQRIIRIRRLIESQNVASFHSSARISTALRRQGITQATSITSSCACTCIAPLKSFHESHRDGTQIHSSTYLLGTFHAAASRFSRRCSSDLTHFPMLTT